MPSQTQTIQLKLISSGCTFWSQFSSRSWFLLILKCSVIFVIGIQNYESPATKPDSQGCTPKATENNLLGYLEKAAWLLKNFSKLFVSKNLSQICNLQKTSKNILRPSMSSHGMFRFGRGFECFTLEFHSMQSSSVYPTWMCHSIGRQNFPDSHAPIDGLPPHDDIKFSLTRATRKQMTAVVTTL